MVERADTGRRTWIVAAALEEFAQYGLAGSRVQRIVERAKVNKQLVFYFLAGATGLILSFLAGVMVGRGVDGGGGVQVARTLAEDRIVGEEPRSTRDPRAMSARMSACQSRP